MLLQQRGLEGKKALFCPRNISGHYGLVSPPGDASAGSILQASAAVEPAGLLLSSCVYACVQLWIHRPMVAKQGMPQSRKLNTGF